MVAFLVGLAMLLVYSATADANGSLRCQGKIISTGTTMAEVLLLCGEPTKRIIEQVPVRSGGIYGFSRSSGTMVVETLVYDRGWGKFPAVLNFWEGKLRRVDYMNVRAGKR